MAEIWGAAIAAAGAVGGGYMASQGAKRAAGAQGAASEQSVAEQRRQFDLLRRDQAPYQQAGVAALNQLMQLYGLGSAMPALPGPANSGGSSSRGSVYAAPVAGMDAASPWSASGFSGVTMDEARASGDIFRLASNPVGAIGSALGVKSDSTFGKILDPAGLFGSHGDEKRNMKAFLAENPGILDAGNGEVMLPDGTLIPRDRLQELAGAWYGATYAPDGNQAEWQSRLASLQAEFGGGQGATIDMAPDGSGRWVPTPGGGVERSMALGVPDAGAPGTPDFSAFYESPDYRFALEQGEQAILRNRSATGGLASGNTLAALTQFGQGLASQQYGNYVNRLAALAGIGQTANQATGAAGIATGQGIADSLIAGGNARASGIVGANNAWADALGTIGGLGSDYFRNRPIGYVTPRARRV